MWKGGFAHGLQHGPHMGPCAFTGGRVHKGLNHMGSHMGSTWAHMGMSLNHRYTALYRPVCAQLGLLTDEQ